MLRRAAGLVNGRAIAAGESGAAARTPAVRRPRGRASTHPGDAGDRHYGAGRGRRTDSAARLEKMLEAANAAGIAIAAWTGTAARGDEVMAQIRLAVVGVGEFGRNHCRVIHEVGRARTGAVVDTDPRAPRRSRPCTAWAPDRLPRSGRRGGCRRGGRAHDSPRGDRRAAARSRASTCWSRSPLRPTSPPPSRLVDAAERLGASSRWATSSASIPPSSRWNGAPPCRCSSRSTGSTSSAPAAWTSTWCWT